MTGPLRVVLLASVALFINYVDRGNLATAATLVQSQLHLSATQLGILLSAFFYTYVPAQPLVGWLGERYGAHRILAGGVALWSVSTLLTGFATSFAALLLLRFMLGLGESVSFPCMSKIIATVVERRHIGLANGVIAFAYLVGPAVGTTVGGLLMAAYGWRMTFIVFGALSLLWLLPWSRVRMTPPSAASKPSAAPAVADGPTYPQILRQRGLWGASLGLFSTNYSFYFGLAWLPAYLINARHFSMQSMAGVLGSAYLINAISGLLGGWLCDVWIRSGRSQSVVYKSAMTLNHVVSMLGMAGMALLPLQGSLICLFAYQVVLGVASPGIYAIAQIMAGPTATGRWVGVQNACGNAAGILAPWITGMLIDATGSFDSAFLLAAIVNMIGLVGWLVILPRVEPLRWGRVGA